MLQLEHTNLYGRYEIQLRPNGKQAASIVKRHYSASRVIKISCEAKVAGGEHNVRFVLKDIAGDEWADSKTVTIKNPEWELVELYLTADPTVDLLFRIDDLRPTKAPSTLFLRKLKVVEELQAPKKMLP